MAKHLSAVCSISTAQQGYEEVACSLKDGTEALPHNTENLTGGPRRSVRFSGLFEESRYFSAPDSLSR